jgi:hypothetical protein
VRFDVGEVREDVPKAVAIISACERVVDQTSPY